MLYSPPAWSSNAAMLKRSDVEQKSDIIVATSRFPSSRDLAKDLTKDREGLIPIPTQPEVYFVVDCPSLHIVGGNNIGPRQQSGTDVSVEFFMYGILLPQITVLTISAWLLNVRPCLLSPVSAGHYQNPTDYNHIWHAYTWPRHTSKQDRFWGSAKLFSAVQSAAARGERKAD
jgi:hypothetical protein